MNCALCIEQLPVSERLVEDQVHELGADFLAQLVLHVDEQLVAVEVGRLFASVANLPFPVLILVVPVFIPNFFLSLILWISVVS